VLEVNRDQQQVVVSHRAVPGYMPAMTMPFRVPSRSLLQHLQPGARIELDLRVGAGQSRVTDLRVRDSREAVLDDVRLPLPAEALPVGSAIPDFALTDQRGQTVQFSGFRDRLVLVNFVYTRCPLPEVCPRLAASFAALQRRLAARIPDQLVLLSVTLDPLFDTPEVLDRYANRAGVRYPGWRLLTGNTTPVARSFGLIYWPEEGVIVHTSRTALVGRRGTLLAMVDGSQYRLEQLADLVRHHLAREFGS
jgi:protein SCO1/2